MASGGDCPDDDNNRQHQSSWFSYEPDDIPPARDPVEASENANGDGNGDSGDSSSRQPLTPRVFCQPESPPDTEENVERQAGDVFHAFLLERYSRDREEGRLDGSAPGSHELTDNRPNPATPEAQIGRRLAEIGDEIQLRYQPEFDEMMKSLDGRLTDSAASFDTFRRVAVRLFQDGNINWGRVVALFCFGYRIAVEKLRHGMSGFLRQVAHWICKFLVTERIARWIAQHGGWRSATHMVIQTVDLSLLVGLVVLAASACFVAFRLSRR